MRRPSPRKPREALHISRGGALDGGVGERALTSGRSEAVEAAILATRAELARFVRRLAGRREDVEDLVQETCARALATSARLTTEAHVRPLLFRIARNLILDRARHESHAAHPRESVESAARRHAGAGLDEALAASERACLVRAALDRLPEQQRVALVLHRLHGLSHAEIAESLGTSEASSRASLYLGMKRLRDLLKPHFSELEP